MKTFEIYEFNKDFQMMEFSSEVTANSIEEIEAIYPDCFIMEVNYEMA